MSASPRYPTKVAPGVGGSRYAQLSAHLPTSQHE
ncbi:hypothetical protein VDGL01_03516 [Verticillium dahliae]